MPTLRVPQAVRAALEQLAEVVNTERLPYGVRVRVSLAARRLIVPRRKPGPKDSRIDAAWIDYRAGMRGLKLFRKHIPGHDKMSQWRRTLRERQLMNALQKRASRARMRRRSHHDRKGQQSNRPPSTPPDNSPTGPSA